jgi:hypothetical protein
VGQTLRHTNRGRCCFIAQIAITPQTFGHRLIIHTVCEDINKTVGAVFDKTVGAVFDKTVGAVFDKTVGAVFDC